MVDFSNYGATNILSVQSREGHYRLTKYTPPHKNDDINLAKYINLFLGGFQRFFFWQKVELKSPFQLFTND